MRARLLIHACETTVTPAHDEPLEEQAARAPTNSGYARNGTLLPQVYRAAAPPFASKKSHSMFFFFFSGALPCASVLRLRAALPLPRRRSRSRSDVRPPTAEGQPGFLPLGARRLAWATSTAAVVGTVRYGTVRTCRGVPARRPALGRSHRHWSTRPTVRCSVTTHGAGPTLRCERCLPACRGGCGGVGCP